MKEKSTEYWLTSIFSIISINTSKSEKKVIIRELKKKNSRTSVGILVAVLVAPASTYDLCSKIYPHFLFLRLLIGLTLAT